MTAYTYIEPEWDILRKPGDCDDLGFIGADGEYHYWEDEGLGDHDELDSWDGEEIYD